MTGNAKQRDTTFHDRVEIVHGPVDHPLEKIDPEHLPEGGGWMSCQKLHIVQHENRQTKKSHFEALASGDGKLEGSNFYAQADEISFDQSKGQFVLRSRAPRRVTLWRQEQLGSNLGGTDAQSIEIIPALKFFKLNGTTGVDGAR